MRGVSDLGSDFQRSDGTILALPLTLPEAEIVDPVSSHSSLINHLALSADSERRVMITYNKFDERGYTRVYTARRESGGWIVHQTTDRTDRWELAGTGTIVEMISFSAPVPWSGGLLCQSFVNRYQSPYQGIRFPDEVSLQPRGRPRRLYPAALETPSMRPRRIGR
jgi:hypothetical protein